MKAKKMLAFVLSFVMLFSVIGTAAPYTLETHAEEVQTYEELYYLGYNEDQVLPGEERYLGTGIAYYLQDEEHPEGEEFEFPVLQLEMNQEYTWGEDGERIPTDREIFYLDGNEDDGWNLHADDYGSVDLTLYYKGLDGKLASWEFTVYSVNEIYYLNWELPRANDQMLTNSEETVCSNVIRNYRNDETGENIYGEQIEDYTLEFRNEYDENAFSAEIAENGKDVIIGSKDQLQGQWFDFAAVRNDENGEVEIARNGFSIGVCNGFFNFEPANLDNVELGETLDFDEVTVVLYNDKFPEGIELTEDLRLSVGYYDENVWEPVEEIPEEGLVAFKRISTDGGNIQLIAGDRDSSPEGWHEVTNRWFWFEGLDYHVWFDNLQNGDHGYCYEGTNEVFTINTDNLQDKENYEIHFEVGLNVDDEFVPFEDQNGLFEVLEEKGQITGIELNTEAIMGLKDQLRDGSWFDICAIVTVNGEEVSRDWRGFELRQEYVEYYYDDWGFGMLPYWDHGVNKEIRYGINNAENPDGVEDVVYATDIRVEYMHGREGCLDITEWEDGNGWNIHANDFCHAVVTLVHPSVTNSEEEMEHSFDIWVGEDVWNLETTMSMGTGDIRPGETMEVRADISRERFTYEEGHHKGDTSQVSYQWGYCEGNPEDLVTFEAEGNILRITANEDAEDGRDTRIWVRAYMTDEDGNILKDEEGNDMEVAYNDFQIGIRNAYPTILPVKLGQVVEIGETFELDPHLVEINENGMEVFENAKFRYEWNPSELKVTGENRKELTLEEDGRSTFVQGKIKVTKQCVGNAAIAIYAYLENEHGDDEEIFCRWIPTGENNYDAWFETDRGDGNSFTFLYADETAYTVPLNVDSMRDENGGLKDHISLSWTVGERNPEGEIIREMTEGVEYTLNEEKTAITFNAEKLIENGFTERLEMQVEVKCNGMMTSEEPYKLIFYIHDERMELEDDYMADTLSIPSWGWFYENNSTNVYVENSSYPDGETLVFEIRDIQVETTDEGEGEVFEIIHDESEGYWKIQPLRCGEAEVIYTLYHESFGEIEVTRTKYSTDELYSLGLLTETHTWQMLPQDELQMRIDVYQYTIQGEDDYEVQTVPSERYNLRFEHDPSLITIDEAYKIISNDNYGSTGFYAEADIQMLNGEDHYVTGNSVEVHVTDGYGYFFAETLYMQPEDVVNVEDLNLYWVERNEANREGDYYPVDNFELYVANELEISEDGKTLRFVRADEIADGELPVMTGAEYYAQYQDAEGWDYFDVVICRHKFTDWVVENKPSATEEGLESRVCEICGKHEENVLEKTSTPVNTVFSDVYKDWYFDYVQYVYDYQLMTGIKGTTRFEPNANITKAQVAQVLYNMEGQPEVADRSVFEDLKDVYAGEWYANAVAWAYNTGVVTGDLNAKKFFPNADVTREQLALMMFRYASYKKYDVSASSDFAGLVNAEKVNNWAADGVKWAVGAGLISGIEKNGVKDLAPQGNASRAQVAAILQRFCENVGK